MNRQPWGIRLFGILVLAGVFTLAYRFPAASGRGFHEPLLAFLFPALLFESLFRGRSLVSAYGALLLGLVGIFHWVPATLESKGGLSFPVALAASGLFYAWEALGFLAVAALARWAHRRTGVLGAALGAAFGMALWEAFGFHVYPWSWGAATGALPWLARSAAFLSSLGLSSAYWGCGAAAGALLAEGQYGKATRVAVGLFGGMLVLGGAWHLLPRGDARTLDVVVIQPDFDPGTRRPDMAQEMWALSDAELASRGLPRTGGTTLLLWPESSVLGWDHLGPNEQLRNEAKQRGVAWLFGTEGGPFNLVRGEVGGRPSFVQAKTELMAFGERNPGPAFVRRWLDDMTGILSQEPGVLGPGSSFRVPTPQGEIQVHPLICSEVLDARRVHKGLAVAGGDLLTNHTNDGWFEKSIATDLHAAQIRLRAVEAGLPLVRATLTGKSGCFREDGSWALWGEARSRAAYAFTLQWRPVKTPARWTGWTWMILGGLGVSGLLLAWRSVEKAS